MSSEKLRRLSALFLGPRQEASCDPVVKPVEFETSPEAAASPTKGQFGLTSDAYFMACLGPAWSGATGGCQKKLCFVSTDRAVLAEELAELAERPDCVYVKYSVYPHAGMYLGRCFLKDEYAVGMLWARYKAHPRLFCTVQDDDFTIRFRPDM
jgi:hypothetical protein